MFVKKSQKLSPLKILSLVTLIYAVLFAGLYLFADNYLNKLSKEFVENWIKSEAVAIQEGQLYSSVSKFQRMSSGSGFIKAVLLVDDGSGKYNPKTQAEFGNKIKVKATDLNVPINEIQISREALFSRIAAYRIPSQSDLVLLVRVKPDFIEGMFFANLQAIMMIIVLLYFILLKNKRTEGIQRFEVIKSTLAQLAQSNEPNAFLKRECPELIQKWNQMKESIEESKKEEKLNFSRRKLSDFAKRTIHDLKSPLTALDTAIYTLNTVSEEQRVRLRSAYTTLRDIVYALEQKSKAAIQQDDGQEAKQEVPAEENLVHLITAVESQIDTTRLQFLNLEGSVEIAFEKDSNAYSLFSKISATELKRNISNILVNAVEAIEGFGTVQVKIFNDSGEACIQVSDNGKGITKEVLENLGVKKISYGKRNGSGIGVFHAKEALEAIGGSLRIKSEIGIGTQVEMRLPISTPPTWFVSEISINQDTEIVILDDAEVMHVVWKYKLNGCGVPNPVRSFTTISDFRAWFENNRNPNLLFLIDYQLDYTEFSGLDLIEDLGIAKQTILVTSYSEEQSILKRCGVLGLRFLSKALIEVVPLNITSEKYYSKIIIGVTSWKFCYHLQC